MKKLIALLLIFTQTAWATWPAAIQGQNDTAPKGAQQMLVPNNQVTAVGAKTLIETGSENLLKNPNFQATISSSSVPGWTLGSGVVASADTGTRVGNDPQSLKLTLTAASGDIITQDVTTGGSLQGINLEDSLYVSTTLTTLQVCTRSGASTATSNCTNVPSTGQWVLVVDNQPGSSASQGISLYASASSTGTVNLSRGYHGLARNVAGVAQSRVLGTISWVCTGTWTVAGSTSYTAFPAATGCSAPTLTGSAQRPATDIPAIKFPFIGSGDLILQYEGEVQNTTTGQQSGFQFWDGTNTAREESWCGNQNTICPGFTQSITYTTGQTNVTLQVRTKTGASGQANLRPDVGTQVIKVIWFPSSTNGQVIQTTDQSDFGWTSYTPTLSASFGTISGLSAQYKRIGDSLYGRANFVSGTLTAALGSISLPSGLTIDTTKMNFAGTAITGNAGQIVGHYASDNSATGSGGSILAGTATSTSNLYIGGLFSGTSSSGSIRFINMNTLTATSQFNLDFQVPISQWANTNRAPNLIGSTTSADLSKSFHLESGGYDCHTGTCTLITSVSGGIDTTQGVSGLVRNGVGDYNIKFAAGTFSAPPNCEINSLSITSGNDLCRGNGASTTSTMNFTCKNFSSLAAADEGFMILCHGPR